MPYLHHSVHLRCIVQCILWSNAVSRVQQCWSWEFSIYSHINPLSAMEWFRSCCSVCPWENTIFLFVSLTLFDQWNSSWIHDGRVFSSFVSQPVSRISHNSPSLEDCERPVELLQISSITRLPLPALCSYGSYRHLPYRPASSNLVIPHRFPVLNTT